MEYHLYPPLLVTTPESDFDAAWETLCCTLLNLDNGTSRIRRRGAPDFGIDLLWDEVNIGYQCKAVISGKRGDLNIAHVLASIDDAVAHRELIGWTRLAICTNVDVTGAQEKKIRTHLPNVELLTKSYWVHLCETFHSKIASRFRALVDISTTRIERGINETSLQNYLKRVHSAPAHLTIQALLYSEKRQEIFELPVSLDDTTEDMIAFIRSLFELPNAGEFGDQGFWGRLIYDLKIDGQSAEPNAFLGSMGMTNRSIITLTTKIDWGDDEGSTTSLQFG